MVLKSVFFCGLSGAENLRPGKYMSGMPWGYGSGCTGNYLRNRDEGIVAVIAGKSWGT